MKTTWTKVCLAIVVVAAVASISLFFYKQYQKQETLATAIDSYIGPFLPTLNSMPSLGTDVAIGKNAVWWIGDGVQFAGGGTERPTGTMRSSWGGGALGLTPRFEDLDSILIVKGTLAETHEYLVVPDGMAPFDITPNPFRSGPPSQYIDKYGKIHSADEFKKDTMRTYGLQVWILDVKSSRIVAYHEFPAVHLKAQYDQSDPEDNVPTNALVDWMESLQKLERQPARSDQSAENYAKVRAGMTENEVEAILGRPDKEVGDFQHKEMYWQLPKSPGHGVFVKFVEGKSQEEIEFGQDPDNFDKVKVGMTENEAESIVGKPDKTVSTSQTTVEAWKVPAIPGKYFLVTFTDGKAQTIDVGAMP